MTFTQTLGSSWEFDPVWDEDYYPVPKTNAYKEQLAVENEIEEVRKAFVQLQVVCQAKGLNDYKICNDLLFDLEEISNPQYSWNYF